MLDSVDYAANAGVVPAIACMGEKDVFFQAHVLMGEAMEQRGAEDGQPDLAGHRARDRPEDARGADAAHRGVRRQGARPCAEAPAVRYLDAEVQRVPLAAGARPRRALRTGGTGRNRCGGRRGGCEGAEERHAVRAPAAGAARCEPETPRGRQEVALPPREENALPPTHVVGKKDGTWAYLGKLDEAKLEGKRPGVQGPIDDAFTTPFLCVRGTGKAWNPAVQAWADANLKRFAYEWHRYFRGELPVKDDTAVTDDDIKRCNLILFGDPGSNALIARVLPKLPVTWTREGTRGRQGKVRRRGPRAGADPAEPARRRAVRRPQQRAHVPREGAGVAQLPAVPAAGRLGGIEGRGRRPLQTRPARSKKR